MRRFATLFLVVAAACSSSPTPQADKSQKDPPPTNPPSGERESKRRDDGWKQYAPKETGFEVWFPRDPAVQTSPQGSETIHVAGVQRRTADGLGYVCQWVTKAKPFRDKQAEAEYLRGQQEGAVQSENGMLIEEKEITRDGLPGREFIIKFSGKNFLHCCVYLAGNQVINLQVWGKDQQAVSSKDAAKFFKSLKIGK